MSIQFEKILERRLKEAKATCETQILSGFAPDYAAYSRNVGRLEGIMAAITIMEETQSDIDKGV